jgi:hypothetical protein
MIKQIPRQLSTKDRSLSIDGFASAVNLENYTAVDRQTTIFGRKLSWDLFDNLFFLVLVFCLFTDSRDVLRSPQIYHSN